MEVDSSSSFSSGEASTSADIRTTRCSTTSHRMPDPDPEKIASLAQTLYESLKALKSSKNKTVSIPVSDFENILARSQQVALLTLAARRSRDDALSLQITDMYNLISSQITNLEFRLGKSFPNAADAEPISNRPPIQTPAPTLLDGIRHSSLYLADGNLIMAAPIEGGTMLFRVHQSILSINSPIFAAMFTLPPPSVNRDVHDGVPFVRMPDDAKDIESLLKVLYNPSELPYKRLDPLTPINVRGTLAMATKYEMEALRERIVTQLQADWPHSLGEWDRLETEICGLEAEHDDDDDYMVDDLYLDERLPEPAAAIRVAADLNVPRILPSAVYHLSRLSTDDDWLELHKTRTTLGLARTARWDLLEAADLKLVLKVRELITKNHSFSALYVQPPKCTAKDDCEDWWIRTALQWRVASDPLKLMKKFVDAQPPGLCKPCWNRNKTTVEECRFDLWEAICSCVSVEDDNE
ncbi:BTB domain-containing protein [Mycena venus]|uniref:BTB domain-containing protein n=1 Tax=Mycena venus TaxID=2733690 RepID=A0A8H7CYH8_9AGAR|nr:BTB domain-containing protein [Mycena venus]